MTDQLDRSVTSAEPPYLAIARGLIGTREVPGVPNSPTIMGWAARLGVGVLGAAYNADSVPWCGLFAAWCVKQAGITPPKIALRAKSWASWGTPLTSDQLAPGAVLVFEREGGGHVGFYVAEDAAYYHVLGGNQSDAVNVMRIGKSRCVARRWPNGVPRTGTRKPVARADAAVSTNEA